MVCMISSQEISDRVRPMLGLVTIVINLCSVVNRTVYISCMQKFTYIFQ